MEHYLGIDVGSVTTKLVVIDETSRPIFARYARTNGRPVAAIQAAFGALAAELGDENRFAAWGRPAPGASWPG